MRFLWLASMCILLLGCNAIPTISRTGTRFDGVHKAALKLQARLSMGVARSEYSGTLVDMAYELLLLNDEPLSQSDSATRDLYQEALREYSAGTEVWNKHEEYQLCMARLSDSRYCAAKEGIAATASAAGISVEEAINDSAIQSVWAKGRAKLEKAEKSRLGAADH